MSVSEFQILSKLGKLVDEPAIFHIKLCKRLRQKSN